MVLKEIIDKSFIQKAWKKVLLDPASDEAYRLKAVEKLDYDVGLFARVVGLDRGGDPCWFVRYAALKRIAEVDQRLLAEMISTPKLSLHDRAAAVGLSSDIDLLYSMTTTSELSILRQEALKRLLMLFSESSLQPLLAEIATKDSDAKIRRLAVEHLNNQSVLQKIVDYEEDSGVLEAAARRIERQGVLQVLALDGRQDSCVRAAATKRLGNKAILQKIAADENEHCSVRKAAVDRMYSLIIAEDNFAKKARSLGNFKDFLKKVLDSTNKDYVFVDMVRHYLPTY